MKIFVGALLAIALFFCLAIAVVFMANSDASGLAPAYFAVIIALGTIVIIGLSSLAVALWLVPKRSTGAKE